MKTVQEWEGLLQISSNTTPPTSTEHPSCTTTKQNSYVGIYWSWRLITWWTSRRGWAVPSLPSGGEAPPDPSFVSPVFSHPLTVPQEHLELLPVATTNNLYYFIKKNGLCFPCLIFSCLCPVICATTLKRTRRNTLTIVNLLFWFEILYHCFYFLFVLK